MSESLTPRRWSEQSEEYRAGRRAAIREAVAARRAQVEAFACINCEAPAGRECYPEYGCEADSRRPECFGHPPGPFDPMGETVYCDGTCNPQGRPVSA